MKKTLAILAGVVTVVAGICFGGYGLAQQQTYAQPANSAGAPRTRIALINLMAVVRNYDKYKNATANIKRQYEEAQNTMKAKRAAILDLQGRAQAPGITPEQKEQYARQLRSLEREFQDQGEDIRQRLEKEQMELLVQVYKEVEDMVTRYARNYDIDLVMHYSDVPPEEAQTTAAIARRAGNNACMPMYIAAGMDISTAITNIMNQSLSGNGAGAATQPH